MPPPIPVRTLISSLSSVLGRSELSLPCDRQSPTCGKMPWPSHQLPGNRDKGLNLHLATAIPTSMEEPPGRSLQIHLPNHYFDHACHSSNTFVAPTGHSFKSTPFKLTFTAQPCSVIYLCITNQLSCIILVSPGSNRAQQGNVYIESLMALEDQWLAPGPR